MVVLLLILLLSVSEFGAFYTLRDLPEDLQHDFYKICKRWDLKIPKKDVVIYEARSLEEFHRITGQTYRMGGVYSKGLIIVQPFWILRKKGLFEKIIVHELLHWVLQENYELPRWFEEGFIMTVLKIKLQDLDGPHRFYLEKFMKEVKYEDIRSYLDSHRCSNGGRSDLSFDVSY